MKTASLSFNKCQFETILQVSLLVAMTLTTAPGTASGSTIKCEILFQSNSPGVTSQNDDFIFAQLKQKFGDELQRARQSDEPDLVSKHVRWFPFENFQVAFFGRSSPHGHLAIRHFIKGTDKFEHFSLDARLQIAQDIINRSILSSAPSNFTVSNDGKYFIQESDNFVQPKNLPVEIEVIEINGKRAWPTPEKLNASISQRYPNQQMRLVRSANPKTNYFGLMKLSMDLMELLAEGKIPVVFSATYGDSLIHSYRIFQFTQQPQWPNIRQLIQQALAISKNPKIVARFRHEADQIIEQLFSEIGHSLYPKSNPIFWSKEPDINKRLAVIQSEMNHIQNFQTMGGYALSNGGEPNSPAHSSKVRLQDRIMSWIPKVFLKGSTASSSAKNNTAEINSPILVEPNDLILIFDDHLFQESFHAKDTKYYYLHWLKEKITQDHESSGYSMFVERISLRYWIFRQHPELKNVEVPSTLFGEERIQAWIQAFRHLKGDTITIAPVPLNKINEYQHEAITKYFDLVFEEAFSNTRWEHAPVQNLSNSWAYAALGLPPEATEAEIKKAYRKLAMQFHPDRVGNSAEALEKLKRINVAYGELSGKAERARKQ